MFLALLLSVLVCFCVWVVTKWRKVRSFWAERGVPYLPPHPIMGSLTFLQRQNPALWMRQIYNEFKSPYVGIWLFWRPGLVVNCPEIARRVLVKDADVFRNRFLSSGKTDPVGGLNIFTVNDPTWTPIRRRLTSVFTAAKLRSLTGITSAKADNFISRIKEESVKNEPIDLRVSIINDNNDLIGIHDKKNIRNPESKTRLEI